MPFKVAEESVKWKLRIVPQKNANSREENMSQNLIDKPVWTYADYCVLPQDYHRHEIIEGDHVVTPSPTSKHQRVTANLQFFLDSYIRSNDLGVLLSAPLDVLFAPTSVVQPDLIFIRKDRKHIITKANIQGAPDLLVEILSPSTAAIDRGGKMELYAKYGVPHYWILDSGRMTLEMYELKDQEYRLVAQFGPNAKAECALFPGLVLTMADLDI
jgi:Uma2 family endonuclease